MQPESMMQAEEVSITSVFFKAAPFGSWQQPLSS
jgi:hypothetical protein